MCNNKIREQDYFCSSCGNELNAKSFGNINELEGRRISPITSRVLGILLLFATIFILVYGVFEEGLYQEDLIVYEFIAILSFFVSLWLINPNFYRNTNYLRVILIFVGAFIFIFSVLCSGSWSSISSFDIHDVELEEIYVQLIIFGLFLIVSLLLPSNKTFPYYKNESINETHENVWR